jgi:hypothetical protein
MKLHKLQTAAASDRFASTPMIPQGEQMPAPYSVVAAAFELSAHVE